MVLDDLEPIAALATGLGAAAIAIVRISGPTTHTILQQCLVPRRRSHVWAHGTMALCKFIDPKTNEVLDEPMAALFFAPHSYTGQNSAEIFLHGSPYIVQRVLATLGALGIRSAEPGEFTRRAFLTGKIDLTGAEGIAALIHAASHQQWVAARHLAGGKLKAQLDGLRATLIKAMAFLEAGIDFPDEEHTAEVNISHVDEQVQHVELALRRLLSTYDSGRVASQGLRVALIGPPNVGKSTLMNCLLNTDRAIVSPEAGTTRDYLEEACLLAGRLIRLVDTAGIRDHAGNVERLGIERSLKIARDADLIVILSAFDQTDFIAEAERVRASFTDKTCIHVVNKGDLNSPQQELPEGWLPVSCQTDDGLGVLRDAIVAKVDAHVQDLENSDFITLVRHRNCVHEALAAIAAYRSARAQGAFEEMLAFELQRATAALTSVLGDISNEDILDLVFSTFCVGK